MRGTRKALCWPSDSSWSSGEMSWYYADDDFALRASNSTRYSSYCLMANRAPSSSPSSRPSYGIDSPTPAPTVFKGVKFSASQVSNAHCLSVYLAFDESSLPSYGSMIDSEWHHLVGVPAVAERLRRDPWEGYRELDEERPHHLQQHQQLASSSGIQTTRWQQRHLCPHPQETSHQQLHHPHLHRADPEFQPDL